MNIGRFHSSDGAQYASAGAGNLWLGLLESAGAAIDDLAGLTPPEGFAMGSSLESTQAPCGSQPAGDGGGSGADALAGLMLSRAGSLPQFFAVHAKSWVNHESTVGASLLAMAVGQVLMFWLG